MATLSFVIVSLCCLVVSQAKVQPETKLYFSFPVYGSAPAAPRPSLFRPVFIPLPWFPVASPGGGSSSGGSSSPVDTSPQGQKAAQQNALDLHNRYRQKHHSPPMTLDDDLNAMALKCAQYYANQQRIDHSCPYRSPTVGENLAGGYGGWDTNSSTTLWYNEINQYNFNNPGFSAATGHFTQVVWKSADKLGYAVATNNGYTAVVAIYNSGQYPDQFASNVLPA